MREVLATTDLAGERFEAARAVDYLAAAGEPFTRAELVELIGTGDPLAQSCAELELEAAVERGLVVAVYPDVWQGAA